MSATRIKPNGVFKYFVQELGLNNVSAVTEGCYSGIGGNTFLQKPLIFPLSDILRKAPELSSPVSIEAHSYLKKFGFYDEIPFSLRKMFDDNGKDYEISEKIANIHKKWESYDDSIKTAKEEGKSKGKLDFSILKKKAEATKKQSIYDILDNFKMDYEIEYSAISGLMKGPLVRESEGNKVVFETIYVAPNIARVFDHLKNEFKNINDMGYIGAQISATLMPKNEISEELAEHPIVEELSDPNFLNSLKISFNKLKIGYESNASIHAKNKYKVLVGGINGIDESVIKEARNTFIVSDFA